MDEIALRSLLMGLRLGRHLPGLVHSYHGPPALLEAVDGEPLTPLAELHDEALQLAGLAGDLPADTAAQRRRVAWLVAQVGAASALARLAGGEEIGYVDLVEELYDVTVQLEPDATFETARRMLDVALPAGGTLRQRLAEHDASMRIPPERAVELAQGLAARMRARTRAQLWMPDHDEFRVEGVYGGRHAIDWRYLGEGRSIVRIDLDRPITLGTLVEVASHHGYPGYHAEASTTDELLRAAGHDELGLRTALSPQALVSEGIAASGREVVMSDQELGLELQRLARSVGLRLDVETELRVGRARRQLRLARGNAAVALHRDGEPAKEVRTYLAEVALVPEDELDQILTHLADRMLGTEPFAEIEGRRLVSEWLELHGQTHGLGRLLAEQHTPGSLRFELRVP